VVGINKETNGFGDIYKEYYGKVFQFVYNLSNDFSFAEDITQETFAKALQKISSFRRESSLLVWLNRIAYNLFIDVKRKKNPILSSDGASVIEAIVAPEVLSAQVEQKIMSECIQSKMVLLPEQYRAVLFLDMNGYSNKEIAEILDCSLEAAKIRLHRARKKVKETLEDHCNLYYDERNVLCCSPK
jgi:RNA polymerase sigma-70 factor, ECF subfamily